MATAELTGHSGPPQWTSWREVPALISRGSSLRRTLTLALLIGTVFVSINQLGVVLAGHATPLLWLKIGVTYLVPFCVSNYGMLVATHRRG